MSTTVILNPTIEEISDGQIPLSEVPEIVSNIAESEIPVSLAQALEDIDD